MIHIFIEFMPQDPPEDIIIQVEKKKQVKSNRTMHGFGIRFSALFIILIITF